jgi:hypothetical protein
MEPNGPYYANPDRPKILAVVVHEGVQKFDG